MCERNTVCVESYVSLTAKGRLLEEYGEEEEGGKCRALNPCKWGPFPCITIGVIMQEGQTRNKMAKPKAFVKLHLNK